MAITVCGVDDTFLEQINAFIFAKIDSVGHLDALCLLADDPERTWTGIALSTELRSNLSLACAQLEALTMHGLAVKASGDTYRYKPLREEDDRIARALLELYRERRPMIISTIYSKPTERVKSLAEAFRLRKGD